MAILIELTDREQALLLAQEMNDHPSWGDLAAKVRAGRAGRPADWREYRPGWADDEDTPAEPYTSDIPVSGGYSC